MGLQYNETNKYQQWVKTVVSDIHGNSLERLLRDRYEQERTGNGT